MSEFKLPEGPGIYTLVIKVARPVRREIGKLGCRDFAKGLYAYTGSALGRSTNLRTRVSRHLASEGKRRWHIDHLLGSKAVAVRAVVYVETSLKGECQVARNIERLAEAEVLVRGFGSSDCHYGCAAHLHHFPGLSLEEAISRVANVYEQVFGSSPSILLHVDSH